MRRARPVTVSNFSSQREDRGGFTALFVVAAASLQCTSLICTYLPVGGDVGEGGSSEMDSTNKCAGELADNG